jgi:hypothetical protein
MQALAVNVTLVFRANARKEGEESASAQFSAAVLTERIMLLSSKKEEK